MKLTLINSVEYFSPTSPKICDNKTSDDHLFNIFTSHEMDTFDTYSEKSLGSVNATVRKLIIYLKIYLFWNVSTILQLIFGRQK
jgi:hypothetical protein